MTLKHFQEREQAKKAFGGKKSEGKKPKTFVPGAAPRYLPPPPQPTGPSAQEMTRIRVRHTVCILTLCSVVEVQIVFFFCTPRKVYLKTNSCLT